MRIAIVDDERPARSELRHQIQELLKEAEIVEGDSGAAALQLAGDGKYELFFLDINLGDISGTVLVNAIHNMQPQANSVSAIKEYEGLVGKYDFELVTKGIATTADVSLAADDLLSKVDCITNLTDNTVVASLPTILEKANDKKIPVFGSEIEQVKIGCLAAEGIDYISLGKQTGKMAAQVLKGEKKASELNFETITTPGFYVNNKVAENLGITVPTDLSDNAVEAFDEITQSK